MGEFDDVQESFDVKREVGPGPMNGEYLLEVKKAERKDTRAGDGVMVEVELRVGSKPFGGRKVFHRFYIACKLPKDDESAKGKHKAAAIGAAQWNEFVRACGLIEEGKADDKGKRALELGLASSYVRSEFACKMLVGRFLQAVVKTEQGPNDDRPQPKFKGSRPIDVDQYHDLLSACDFSRKDEAGAPPF